MVNANKVCTYKGCLRKIYTSGYCSSHSRNHVTRENYTGDRFINFCTMPECNRIVLNGKTSLCSKHYQQQPEIQKRSNDYQKKNENRRASLKRYHASPKHKSTHQKYRTTITGRYGVLKRGASKRGIKLEFSIHEYTNFVESQGLNCHYCSYEVGPGSALDRIDNDKNYTLDNILICCGQCNRLRQDHLTVEETVELVKRLQQLRGRKNIWETDPSKFIPLGESKI